MIDGYGDEVLTLIRTERGTDGLGYPTTSGTRRRQVYAQLRSVGRSEFYQAHQAGIRAEVLAIVRAFDYEGETEAEFNGRRFTVIRTFRCDRDRLELTLSDREQVEVRR